MSHWISITPSTPTKTHLNLIDVAMSILQDTYYDYKLIRDFAPQHIAIAIIYLLIRIYALEIPNINNDNEHLHWMKVNKKN